jgi:predicted nucleic acid-binding protein
MDRIVIDTSMWIEAFRPGCDPTTAGKVKGLIRSGRVLLPGIVKAELLRGAKTQAEFDHLKELLEALTPLPLAESFWDELSGFSFGLFCKGLTIPLVDTAIALLCIQHRLALFHRDRHFDLMAEVSELKIYPGATAL